MHFPKLTPLQSRFAASLAASLVLVVLYFTLSNPHFAYAADVDSITHSDHNHPRLLDLHDQSGLADDLEWDHEQEADRYEPDFVGLDRSVTGRASDSTQALGNNDPGKDNISGGQVHYWTFPNSTLWGSFSAPTPGLPSDPEKRDVEETLIFETGSGQNATLDLAKRQDLSPPSRLLSISFNTCDQPQMHASDQDSGAPQLELYLSLSSRNQQPGPGVDDPSQITIAVDGGFGGLQINVSSDVWFGVAAPTSSSYDGTYNYELTASIDRPYAAYDDFESLFFLDSDNFSALLVSNDTTDANSSDPVYQEWMSNPPPFSIFVQNQNDPSLQGLQKSYCGLQNHAQIQGNLLSQNTSGVDVDMTASEGQPRQQFYVKNLNASSTYYAYMALDGNSTAAGGDIIGGGGKVWKNVTFTTKSDGNCQVIYNLPFCNSVAYAVPSNPNVTNLSTTYDSNAANLYTNFSYSLQQIACNTTSTAQYSLARTCTDCANAYKLWLCAVTIPRCADFSSPYNHLQPRAIAYPFQNGTIPTADLTGDLSFSDQNKSNLYMNTSRNPLIDTVIHPGPYKELLPCKDICYDLVRSCPASLGFACPLEGKGLNYSYGDSHPGPELTCNYPGETWLMSGAARKVSVGWVVMLMGVLSLFIALAPGALI